MKLRNSKGEFKHCDSLVEQVYDLRESLGKFTQGKEKVDLILSCQIFSINKNY